MYIPVFQINVLVDTNDPTSLLCDVKLGERVDDITEQMVLAAVHELIATRLPGQLDRVWGATTN